MKTKHEKPIEAIGEDQYYDTDGGESTETTSLSSSITNYVYENGRRYNSKYREGNYAFPNDEKENARLELIHHVFTSLFGGRLYFAPLRTLKRVLDIGTGTGNWAIDMADTHKDTTIIGTDISPIQPSWSPPNVRFEIDDAESDWNYAPDSFDYIHFRHLIGSIADWPRLIRQSYNVLKPGAWLEGQECYFYPTTDDSSLPESSAFKRWHNLITEASIRANRRLLTAAKIKGWFEDAGFVDVTETVIKLPNGAWPKDPRLKEIGAHQMNTIFDGLDAISLSLFTHMLGWKMEEVNSFLTEVKVDLKDRRIHSYYPV
ncbi:S-adenosyl-L-methionine-dependent methyltransferase [Choiromyces venosus 120613-1]|uniref:S-adenosyl-L-methionine-dependent methyltransferase n=1 Tax=Choiromyces venosus 120613-1 TaxID=1336337 RepID=A0A3N4IXQ0_9PEZI|nr:S-adenosyl-L-methionine-dependent methyltransferase [Choiromyces venosus 120613-1]